MGLPDSPSWVRRRASLVVPSDHVSRDGAALPAHETAIRVLLISDLLLGRAGLHHVLEDVSGIVLVGEAGTSAEAVDIAARERPDVILIDLDLRTDAFDCLERLSAAAPDSRVIALSDRTRAADHHVLIELGATGLVLKNERPEVLIKAIRKVHGGEVWLDRTITARVLSRIAQRRHVQDAEAEKIASLTRREHEIIALVGEGLKNGVIAERLFVSEATVRNHLTSILSKLALSDRFELAVYAFRHGLVHYPSR
jgi:two-component system, NarL family, nitrate/nitrite response regulator NarL